jgi:hypothetical protein
MEKLYSIRLKKEDEVWTGEKFVKSPRYVYGAATGAYSDKPYLFTEQGLAMFREMWKAKDTEWLDGAVVETWSPSGEESPLFVTKTDDEIIAERAEKLSA